MSGHSGVDQSLVTGEPVPVEKNVGEEGGRRLD
jgi:cation transport ATPase